MKKHLLILLAALSLSTVLALPASAQTMISSTPYSTTLDVSGQSLFRFQYTARPGETVTADTGRSTRSVRPFYPDTELSVYDLSGALLAFNDDYYSNLASRVEVGPFTTSTTLIFEITKHQAGDEPPLPPFLSGTTLVFDVTSEGGVAEPVVTVDGFYRPVDMGIVNDVRGGRTVPLKFEVVSDGIEVTDPAVVASFAVIGPNGPVDFTSPGGTGLRYDTEVGQFIMNWQVPTAPGYSEVTMTLVSGQTLTAAFNVR
jgi:hypothetical protein